MNFLGAIQIVALKNSEELHIIRKRTLILTSESEALKGKSIVVNGVFTFPRDDIKKWWKNMAKKWDPKNSKKQRLWVFRLFQKRIFINPVDKKIESL